MSDQNIVWAVDPSKNPKISAGLVQPLRKWSGALNCKIQPVLVFSTSIADFSANFAPLVFEDSRQLAEKAAQKYFKTAHGPEFLPAKILYVASLSTRRQAAELANYAFKINARFIVAHTRAKTSWNPFSLGGFAHSLMAISKVPVLLLNNQSRLPKSFKSILFPTDFSRESKNALFQLEPLAQSFHSQVVIYNQVESPEIYPMDLRYYAPGGKYSVLGILKELQISREKKALKWSHLLQDRNLKTTVIVNTQKKFLPREIIETADKTQVDMIALANHQGPFSQSLIGSVALDVILKAKCPVLVFTRPHSPRKPKEIEIQKRPTLQTATLAPH